MAHQRAIEVDGKQHKNHPHRHHDDGGGQRRVPAAVLHPLAQGLCFGLCCERRGVGVAGLYGQELDPAEEHHLGEEQQDAQGRGEAPGQLDVVVHALVGRLADGVQVVDVADGLHVGQDAGADQQSEEVHRHQHRGAHAEGDEQHARVVVVHLQLHLHHGHLQHPERCISRLMYVHRVIMHYKQSMNHHYHSIRKS